MRLSLFLRFLSQNQREAGHRRADFLALFNHESAEAVSPPRAYADLANHLVQSQLQHPNSASFVETFVRRCDDKLVRVAGTVQFAGMDGSISRAGYMVEFDSWGRSDLLDLRSNFDPVSLKILPEFRSWDGIPYKRAVPPPKLHGPGWRFWAMFIIGVMLLIVMMVNLWRPQ